MHHASFELSEGKGYDWECRSTLVKSPEKKSLIVHHASFELSEGKGYDWERGSTLVKSPEKKTSLSLNPKP